MSKKLDLIFERVLDEVSLSKQSKKFMQESLDNFLEKIEKRRDKFGIKVEFFVGGSFAKNTMIKKKSYDIDLFFRFDKKYSSLDYHKLTKKILRFTPGLRKVKGSRDYFQVKINSNFKIEVIPVKKISRSSEAENITDLSYSHVKYIKRKIKDKKILDQIRLAKAFMQSIGVYGAESYVQGFSGYSLELLVYYYGSFEKMLKALSKSFKKKLIIDIEGLYKKGNVLLDMNGSKLESPIILVDPTLKERNVLAALSEKKFSIFQKNAKDFLKKPSVDFFKFKKINLDKIRNSYLKKGWQFIVIKTKTKKQKGDVAGTKLLKFHRHLEYELGKFFDIKLSGFDYLDEKYGRSYFAVLNKKEIIFSGPLVEDKKNVLRFKQEHKNTYIRGGRIYSKKRLDLSLKEFINLWKKKNKRKIKEMYISNFKIYL